MHILHDKITSTVARATSTLLTIHLPAQITNFQGGDIAPCSLQSTSRTGK